MKPSALIGVRRGAGGGIGLPPQFVGGWVPDRPEQQPKHLGSAEDERERTGHGWHLRLRLRFFLNLALNSSEPTGRRHIRQRFHWRRKLQKRC